jgi:hypothetical protein
MGRARDRDTIGAVPTVYSSGVGTAGKVGFYAGTIGQTTSARCLQQTGYLETGQVIPAVRSTQSITRNLIRIETAPVRKTAGTGGMGYAGHHGAVASQAMEIARCQKTTDLIKFRTSAVSKTAGALWERN